MQLNSIKVSNLRFGYSNEPVIKDLSFEIKEGDFVGIIGPNGAGKTTLVKLLLGLLSPSKGTINIFGKNTVQAREYIGYVPQKIDVEKSFPASVNEILSLVDSPNNFSEILEKMELEKILARRFTELSGGQQQRVITALSLMKNPRILVLDEPSSGIDVKGQTKFNDLVSRLNKEENVTVLMISHDVNIISKYAKTALCINKPNYCFGPTTELPEFISEIFGEDYKAYPHYHGDTNV